MQLAPEQVVKPMLAKDPKYDENGQPVVPFPCIVQPKLDGIRAFVVNGQLRSRTFKLIPNAEIQAALGRPEFEGLDGEIIVGDPTAEGCMQRTSSFVMAPNKTGEDWTFHVFDKWDEPGSFDTRYSWLERSLPEKANGFGHPTTLVSVTRCQDQSALEFEEQFLVSQGHEGIIVRDPSAPYKHGRSGTKGPLLKVKRFIDFEAEVIGVYEEMENTNEAKKDAFGRTERSTMKAGKVGKGTLGGLVLRALNGPCEGIEFRCGTGFNREQREALWYVQKRHDEVGTDKAALLGVTPLVGRVAKIKSFPVGVKEKPRFPVWLGFRHMEIDG